MLIIALYSLPIVTRDPTRTNLGVVFSHQDYLLVDGNWTQTATDDSTIHSWINFVNGVPQEFLDLRITVSPTISF
jgi:hypothetical protein